jgi:multiple sugar transport system permease protein
MTDITHGLRAQQTTTSDPARRMRLAETLAAAALSGPAVALLLALFLLPAMAIFVIAVTNWQFGARTLSFVGLQNFADLLRDPTFTTSLRNTFAYVALVVPASVGIGLLIAIVIESGKTLRGFYRAAHFVPYMATLAAMAIVWEALLHPSIGLINQVLRGFGFAGANWLRDQATVLPTLAVIGVWKGLGFSIVMFLAGLKSIPQDLYDAADIDGADEWLDRLRSVTLPMLGPVTMFVVIVTALRAFETFDTVKILTQGGPSKASEMLLYTLYTESFEFLRAGYGAAVTVVFLFIVIALTLLQARVFDKRVHYS